MSAITPTTIYRESNGSLTLHQCYFATASTDTWSSGMQGVVGYWAQANSFGGTAVSALSASGQTAGVFTITNDQAGPVTLYVLSRS
jgi:hypothetical protein